MMKTRLSTNIDGYLLEMQFLFQLAYFDGAGLILSCLNANASLHLLQNMNEHCENLSYMRSLYTKSIITDITLKGTPVQPDSPDIITALYELLDFHFI